MALPKYKCYGDKCIRFVMLIKSGRGDFYAKTPTARGGGYNYTA